MVIKLRIKPKYIYYYIFYFKVNMKKHSLVVDYLMLYQDRVYKD